MYIDIARTLRRPCTSSSGTPESESAIRLMSSTRHAAEEKEATRRPPSLTQPAASLLPPPRRPPAHTRAIGGSALSASRLDDVRKAFSISRRAEERRMSHGLNLRDQRMSGGASGGGDNSKKSTAKGRHTTQRSARRQRQWRRGRTKTTINLAQTQTLFLGCPLPPTNESEWILIYPVYVGFLHDDLCPNYPFSVLLPWTPIPN